MPDQPAGAIRTLLAGAYRDVKFSSDGTLLYASAGQSVTVVNVATGATVAQYDLGRQIGAIDLSVDGRYLAVTPNPTGTSAPQSSATFFRIDVTTGGVETFTFATTAVDPSSLLSSDFMDIVQLTGNRIMATTQQLNGGFVQIDLNGATPVVTKIAASNGSPGYLEASADRSEVLVLGRAAHHYVDGTGITGTLTYDPYAGASVPMFPPEYYAGALSPNSDILLLDGRVYNTALVRQTAVEAQIKVPISQPVFNADGTRLYGMVDNLLAVYDTATWQVLAVYPIGATAAVNFQAAGGGVYAHSGFGDTLELSGDGRYLSLIAASGLIVLDLQTAVSIATPGSDDLRGMRTQIGLGGNDLLGGSGATGALYGGTGDDQYTIVAGSGWIVEHAGEGTDTALVGTSSFVLGGNVENATATTAAATTLQGNDLSNVLIGNAGADWLLGFGGADQIFGMAGADRIEGGSGNDTIDGGDEADSISGGTGADSLIGGNGNDTITTDNFSSFPQFSPGDDLGIEIDTANGGDGDDVVWIGSGDSADGGSGTDALGLSLYAFPAGVTLNTASLLGAAPFVLGGGTIVNFEKLARLVGTSQADTLTVSDLTGRLQLDAGGGDDVIIATSSPVDAIGGPGNDRFFSGPGADTYNGSGGSDTIDYSQSGVGITVTLSFSDQGTASDGDSFRGAATVAGSNFADVMTGTNGSQRFEGNGGSDVLIGAYGADTLLGGDGDDTLFAEYVSPSFSAPAYGNPGTPPVLDTGNDRDTLSGGDGNDAIFSGIGDSVDGGAGFDTLYVTFAGYMPPYFGVTADFTQASVSVAGATIAGIEHVAWIQGSGYADTIRLDNASGALAVVFGGWGSDVLTAGLYTGSLWGEEGNDTLDGSGSQHLLFLDGGIGNDILTGSSGGEILDGGAGADAMTGGMGNDTYVVDSVSDTVNELAGEGTDTVLTALTSYTLTGEVENLTYTGLVAATLTGNGLDNTIVGGAAGDTLNGGIGNDTLNGGAGADAMSGGTGNDTFVVDNFGDTVTELAGEGTDTVQTALGSSTDYNALYFLPDNVENLVLTGSAQGAHGNALDNFITGSGGNDLIVLSGGAPFTLPAQGADTVNAWGGDDYLFFGGSLDAADTIDGGAGYDFVGLLGTYSGLVLSATSFAGVERLAMYSSGNAGTPYSYAITTHDGNVASGQTLAVTAATLLLNEVLTFNGNAETNGKFQVTGGRGADSLTGGEGSDRFIGGLGADVITGGLGNDVFQFNTAGDSTAAARDQILDFAAGDKLDLWFVDASTALGGNQKFDFIGANAFGNVAGQLRAAELSPGQWLVEGDVDGDGLADLSIQVTVGGGHLIGAGDFVL